MVQWLGLGAFAAAGMGAIPGRGTKIPQAVQRGQKKKKTEYGQLRIQAEYVEVFGGPGSRKRRVATH